MRTLTGQLPRLFIACLAVCAATGLALACRYRPFGDVFGNVEGFTAYPFGLFLRNLHHVSGQACALLALVHASDHLVRGAATRMRPGPWLRLGLGLGCCFALLFTGYVLAGDLRGVLAGTVCRAILETIPFFGARLAPLFVGSGDAFFFAPYLHHCVLLPAALALLLRGHVRAWLPSRELLARALIGLALLTRLFPLAPALPPDGPARFVSGPWFFAGLQELLRYAPVWFAGLVLPATCAGLFLALPLLRRAAAARFALLAALAAYLALSLKHFLA